MPESPPCPSPPCPNAPPAPRWPPTSPPDQVAADLDRYSPAEVWPQRVRRDNSGRLAQYKPRDAQGQRPHSPAR
ncbi:hypothetical protein ACWCXB_30200 [Streptomyces sp. NPDC001514]